MQFFEGSGKEVSDQQKIRQQFAHQIRTNQKMRMFRQRRLFCMKEFQDEQYYESMDKFFYEEQKQEEQERLRQIEENQLRFQFQKEQEQYYEEMYRVYVQEHLMESEQGQNKPSNKIQGEHWKEIYYSPEGSLSPDNIRI